MSWNRITTIEGPYYECYNLEELNLNQNRIKSCVAVKHHLGSRLRCLLLKGNSLKETRGLDGLYGIEALDLSDNLLTSMLEVTQLMVLPSLRSAWFKGNPVSSGVIEGYRNETLVKFMGGGSQGEFRAGPGGIGVGLVLDGVDFTSAEVSKAAQVCQESRRKEAERRLAQEKLEEPTSYEGYLRLQAEAQEALLITPRASGQRHPRDPSLVSSLGSSVASNMTGSHICKHDNHVHENG